MDCRGCVSLHYTAGFYSKQTQRNLYSPFWLHLTCCLNALEKFRLKGLYFMTSILQRIHRCMDALMHSCTDRGWSSIAQRSCTDQMANQFWSIFDLVYFIGSMCFKSQLRLRFDSCFDNASWNWNFKNRTLDNHDKISKEDLVTL